MNADSCCNCTDDQHHLASLYLELIETHLIPEISKLLHTGWISFKTDSTLCNYLAKHGYLLPSCFQPEELSDILYSIFKTQNLVVKGNSSLILLNNDLQEIFNTPLLYTPEINEYFATHIYRVNDRVESKLINTAIHKQLYVNFSFENIIFNDSSSLFWLEPEFNEILNQHKKLTYTWNEILASFEKYIVDHACVPEDYCNSSIITLSPQAKLLELLPCNVFDRSQINTILKQRTQFLGRKKSILTLCPFLNFSQLGCQNSTVIWLENMINSSLKNSFSYHALVL